MYPAIVGTQRRFDGDIERRTEALQKRRGEMSVDRELPVGNGQPIRRHRNRAQCRAAGFHHIASIATLARRDTVCASQSGTRW